VLDIASHKDLPPLGTAHHRSDLGEFARLARRLDLDSLGRHLIGEHPTRVLPPSEDQSGLMFVSGDNGLLDVQVDWRLDRAHESGAHVHARGTQTQSCHQPISVCKSSRGDEGRVAQFLPCAAVQNQRRDVGFTDVACTFESIDRQDVDSESNGGFRMSYGGGPARICQPRAASSWKHSLVDDGDPSLLQLLDDGSRAVAGSFDDGDALLNDGLSECGIVWGIESRKQREIDTERLLGQGARLADFLPKRVWVGLGESIDDSQAAGVRDGRCQLGICNPLKATLDTE
jgi:hypothetical protein